MCRSCAAVWFGEYPHIHGCCPQEEDRGLRRIARFPTENLQVHPALVTQHDCNGSSSHSLAPQTHIMMCTCPCTRPHPHRTIPLFVWHRQNWNVVYPQLRLDNEAEMEELAKHGTYVAGFLNPSVQGRTNLYDLFVNGEALASVTTSLV